MTIKEKFEEILIAFWTSDWESECEKVADEFSIDFAEWLFNIDKEVLKKQLNHFKEEKGL